MPARYKIHTAKALEVILWLVNERPGMDVYHVVKCAFYADKYHLNEYGRPIAGDLYQAARYGPLGQSVYGLLTNNPLDALALGLNFPVPLTVRPGWQVYADREPNLNRLSESDVEALRHAVERYADMSFNELVELSHSERAYQRAFGGPMRYEDLLDETPDLGQRQSDIVEVSGRARL